MPIDGSAYIEETIDPDPLGDGSAEDVRLKIRLDTHISDVRSLLFGCFSVDIGDSDYLRYRCLQNRAEYQPYRC